MTRTEVLAKAEEYVSNDRKTQYGEPEDAFGFIAELWRAYLVNRSTPEPGILPVDAFDVACMLSLMKLARMSVRPTSPDSCIDLAGYAACAGEILEGAVPAPALSPIQGVPARDLEGLQP